MAPATAVAGASSRSRRLRIALVLALWLIPSASIASDGTSTLIYIWRDANGVVRFSVPSSR